MNRTVEHLSGCGFDFPIGVSALNMTSPKFASKTIFLLWQRMVALGRLPSFHGGLFRLVSVRDDTSHLATWPEP